MNFPAAKAWAKAQQSDEAISDAAALLELVRTGEAESIRARTKAGTSMTLAGILLPSLSGAPKIVHTTPLAFATLIGDIKVLEAVLTDPLADPHKGLSKDELLYGMSPYAAVTRAKLPEIRAIFDNHLLTRQQAASASTSYTRTLIERFIN